MKRFSVMISAAVLLLAGCRQDMLEPVAVQGESNVDITIQITDGMQTKAVAYGESVTVVYYEVYAEDGKRIFPKADADRIFPANLPDKKDENAIEMKDGKASLKFQALKNKQYRLLFWAMGDLAPYTWTDFSSINMNYDNTAATDREAFFGSLDINTQNTVSTTVTLTRPFALLSIGTEEGEVVMYQADQTSEAAPHVKTGVDTFEKYYSYDGATVTVSGVSSVFNVLTGKALNNNYAPVFETNGLALNPGTDEGQGYLVVKENGADKNYVHMTAAYILPPADGNGTVEVNAVFRYAGTQFMTYNMTNIPVQTNCRTNILGRVFTGTGSLEVKLDSDWENPVLEYDMIADANTLQDAINTIPEGGTAEINISGDVVFEEEDGKSAAISIPAGRSVVLNLGKNTLTYVSELAGTSMINNKGNLTINGGKVVYTYAGEPDKTYGKGNYTINNTGTLTINGAVVENLTKPMSHASYTIDNNSINSAATLIIESGLVENPGGHAVRMIAGKPNTLTVNDGEICGTRAVWVQLPGSNKTQAPEVNVNINGGVLNATGESADHRLALYSYSYGQNMKNVIINITDGEIVGDVALTGGSNKTDIETLNIKGGKFEGLWGCAYSYGELEASKKTISITGGTFNSSEEVINYVPEGYTLTDNNDGTWTVNAE